MKLHELAGVVRSKNAGPFKITIDIFFDDLESFERVRRSGVLDPASVASVFGIPESDVVGSFWEERAMGAKVTLRKRPSSNDMRCADVFGAHQYLELAYADVD